MCCFLTSIFWGSASILEPLGLPIWSQVGPKWHSKVTPRRFKSLPKLNVYQKLHLGGLRARFWMPQGSILEGRGTIFRDFRMFFCMLPRRCPSSNPSRNPSSDLSHVGRADALKKMSICRVTERQPRIARLPHLKIQTPRTPRTPRTSRTRRVKSSTTTAENKRVGRRWSPPGGLQLNIKLSLNKANSNLC